MKHTILLFVLFTCLCASSTAQHKASKNKSFRVTGYVRNDSSLLNNVRYLDLDKITHLNIAFVNPDAVGEFETNPDLRKVASLAHEKHVQVLISIAGGSPPKYLTSLLVPGKQKALIQNLIDLVRSSGIDGIDVDLEGQMIDSNYESFVINLKLALEAQHKTMTAAIATYYKDQYTDKALAQFDFLNIMSYDETGPWNPQKPGQHASYQLAVNDLNYWSVTRGIPKERLGLGLPFYGYGFGSGVPESMTYRDIIQQFPGSDSKDEISVPEGGIIYYNGTTTIQKKIVLALKETGGIMIWHLLQDAQGKASLLNLIHQQIL